jgi:hypothetical protein
MPKVKDDVGEDVTLNETAQRAGRRAGIKGYATSAAMPNVPFSGTSTAKSTVVLDGRIPPNASFVHGMSAEDTHADDAARRTVDFIVMRIYRDVTLVRR